MAKHQQVPAESPERVALAEAIEQAVATTARRDALASAREQAGEAVSAAREAVEYAGVGIETATAGAAEHAVLAAMGRAEDRPEQSVRHAHERLRDAEDDLSAAIEARTRLGAMSEPTEADVSDWLRRAALAVVRMEHRERADAIVGEAEVLCAQMSRLCGQIHWLFSVAELFERNMHGLATDSRVNTVLSYKGDDAAFQAGRADLERLVARLAENAGSALR